MEKLYTCRQIAEHYEVTVSTISAWIRAGMIPAVRVGRVYRIKESDLLAFERENATRPETHTNDTQG